MSRSAAMIIAAVMDSILNNSDCNVTLSYCREKVLDIQANGIFVVLVELYQFERNSFSTKFEINTNQGDFSLSVIP